MFPLTWASSSIGQSRSVVVSILYIVFDSPAALTLGLLIKTWEAGCRKSYPSNLSLDFRAQFLSSTEIHNAWIINWTEFNVSLPVAGGIQVRKGICPCPCSRIESPFMVESTPVLVVCSQYLCTHIYPFWWPCHAVMSRSPPWNLFPRVLKGLLISTENGPQIC